MITGTTYMSAVPERRTHKVIAHVNRLKPWRTPSAGLFSVVVAQDSEGSDHPIGRVNLGEEEITEEQKKLLQARLDNHKLTVESGSLGKALECAHSIAPDNSSPVRSYPYRIVPGWKDDLKAEVMKLLKQGIIQPSQSPWTSPMVPVSKSNGSIRLCIDYRKLNAATMDDPYEMPRIGDLLDEVAEARWISKLDLNQGFYQIPMDRDSMAKTAFFSPWGKFAFTLMPFGLKNAPTTFQRYMDVALREQSDFSNTYIDDVFIYSSTFEEHLVHIDSVLEALRATGLTAKPEKCVWGKSSLEYLGHKVGLGKVEVPEARVKALKDFKRLVKKRDLRAFLGTVGYYRRFIPDYARWVGHLNKALCKKAPNRVEWDDRQVDFFNHLITVLCSSSVLWLPRHDDHFYCTLMPPSKVWVRYCRLSEMVWSDRWGSTRGRSTRQKRTTQPLRLSAWLL